MQDSKPPEYRVRLFLAVDLAGSTAFKARQKDPISWVPKFKEFYSDFISHFSAKHNAFCETHDKHCESFKGELPKLWKTVGDEIIFVNRVKSCVQVISYVHAFVHALETYSSKLRSNHETENLDVKGNGWIASFPYPNQTVQAADNKVDLVDEAIELKADEEPHKFEFLGPGIDAGFRIAGNSRPDLFTISPALALCLTMIPENKDTIGSLGDFEIKFSGVNGLKGVVQGEDYPILGIDTERDPKRKTLNSRMDELAGSELVNQSKLREYLKEFVCFHDVPAPKLKLEANSRNEDPPEFYSEKFLPAWNHEYSDNESSDQTFTESEQATDDGETDDGEAESWVDRVIKSIQT